MPAKEKYTDPALRDKVKNEVHQSDKGGAPGQWSARKVEPPISQACAQHPPLFGACCHLCAILGCLLARAVHL